MDNAAKRSGVRASQVEISHSPLPLNQASDGPRVDTDG